MRLQVIIILVTALVGAAGAETVYTVHPDINGDKPGNCIVEVIDDPAAVDAAIVDIISSAPDTSILIRNKWYRVFRGKAPVEGLALETDWYEITAKAGGNFKTTEFDVSLESGKRYDFIVEFDKHSMSKYLHFVIVIGGVLLIVGLGYWSFSRMG